MARKGNFNFLTIGAVSAGSFFLVLVVMALMFANLGTNTTVNAVYGSTTTAVSGESITLINGTAVNVANNLVNPDSWAIYNDTNILGLGNFTFNNATGTVTLIAANTIPQYNNTAVSVNYTYDNSGTLLSGDGNATAVVNDAKTTNTTLSSLGTIFVYTIFLVAVIGLLALIGYGAYKLKR